MIRKNNKRLYESIMKDVARTVKRHLNEKAIDINAFYDQKPNNYDIKVEQLYDLINETFDINDDIRIELNAPINVDIPIYEIGTDEIEYISYGAEVMYVDIDMDDIDDSNIIYDDYGTVINADGSQRYDAIGGGETPFGTLSYKHRMKLINAMIRTLKENY